MGTKRITSDSLLASIGNLAARIEALAKANAAKNSKNIVDDADEIQQLAAELKMFDENRVNEIHKQPYTRPYKQKVTFFVPRLDKGLVFVFTTYYA